MLNSIKHFNFFVSHNCYNDPSINNSSTQQLLLMTYSVVVQCEAEVVYSRTPVLKVCVISSSPLRQLLQNKGKNSNDFKHKTIHQTTSFTSHLLQHYHLYPNCPCIPFWVTVTNSVLVPWPLTLSIQTTSKQQPVICLNRKSFYYLAD